MYDIKDILNNIREIPAMPNVVVKALRLIKDDKAGAKDVANIMSYDQALSTKILNLVNSAYYGFSQQILSINQAVALLGINGAKNIIITVAMKPMLTNHLDKNLWTHSIRVAVGCEFLAEKYNLMDPDEAFILGFLHDIGKIIFNMKFSTEYALFKKNNSQSPDILGAEQKVFGIDHCQAGGLLAKKWKLPIALINAIKYHHEPILSSMLNISTMVYLADKIMNENYESWQLNTSYLVPLKVDLKEIESYRDELFMKANSLLRELS